MPTLSNNVIYICRKASFPIEYCPKNREILRTILHSLDRTIPLRKLIRDMIKNIDRQWSVTYSSIYLAVMRYIYFLFLSHSSKEMTLSVIGRTDELMLSPEGQDFIKDYALYKYRAGKDMLPDGEEWISQPEFDLIQDEPDINIMFPWEYDIDDWEYAFIDIDSMKVDQMGKFLQYSGLEEFKKLDFSREIDLYRLEKYISDTAYFDPEYDCTKTRKKIDHIDPLQLVAEIKNPTIKRFEFLRKAIYVSPQNIRDTFIPSWKTFCAMFVIESLCDKIINAVPEIRIGKINSGLSYGKYHIMIDIKKFGITFPKELILNMIEMIGRLYHVDLSVYYNAYKDYILYKDNEIFYPKRGFGLGNFNKLATIAHYLIAKCSGLKFYVYSDDIVFLCDKKPEIEILEDFERFYNSFGLILNRKKCYISDDWEFLGESSHEFFEQVESNHCTVQFVNAFFSTTLLEVEEKEKNVLDLYKECRDLWLKNHEIHPLLREDLLPYPESMGGWVRTNSPLTYCDEAGLEPSTFTKIKELPKKISLKVPDEYYQCNRPFDFYIDSIVRTLSVSNRNRYSNWKRLSFLIKEEKRYKKAPIGCKSFEEMIKFGIDHQDLPDYLLTFRKSPSQIKTYVKVPSMFRRGGLPNPYPLISVRDSDKLIIHQLSYYTNYPIYTKYMMELKKGKGIFKINHNIPLNHKSKLEDEISLVLLFLNYQDNSFNFHPKYFDREDPIQFDEMDLEYIQSLQLKLTEDRDLYEDNEDIDDLDYPFTDNDSLKVDFDMEEDQIDIEEEDLLEDLL